MTVFHTSLMEAFAIVTIVLLGIFVLGVLVLVKIEQHKKEK